MRMHPSRPDFNGSSHAIQGKEVLFETSKKGIDHLLKSGL